MPSGCGEEIVSLFGFLDVHAEAALEEDNDLDAVERIEPEAFAEDRFIIADLLRLDVFQRKVGHEQFLEFGADQREQFFLGKVGVFHSGMDVGGTVDGLEALVQTS